MTPSPDLAIDSLTEDVWNALKTFSRDDLDDSPLQKLLIFRTAQRQHLYTKSRQVTSHLLNHGLALLAERSAAHADILRNRYLDSLSVQTVANQMHMAVSTVHVQQREAVERLAQILYDEEIEARAAIVRRLQERLPLATYTHLVGVDKLLQQMLEVIEKPGAPWILSIEGAGGIGKSALADALFRRVAELGIFEDVGWVSLQSEALNWGGEILPTDNDGMRSANELIRRLMNELMPERAGMAEATGPRAIALLRERLQSIPHLLVVDNLETLEDLQTLVPILQKLANPTKFILTSRKSLYTELNIWSLGVPQLSEEHTLQLTRQELVASNLPNWAAAPDAELLPIYETVGGNPLALRLVVGLLHIHPLQMILDDLRAARGQAVHNLYTFIYRRAWNSLDELSRQVFLAMPLLPQAGDTLDYLASVCTVGLDDLRNAVQKLVTLNLVDSRGDLNNRHYSIHALTRTFLLEQVVRWE